MSLPRYPEYKQSDSAWCDVIPGHWQVLTLARVLGAPVTDGPHLTPEFIEEGIPFLSVDAIQEGELVFDGCRFVSLEDHNDFSRKAAPRRNDILMGKAASIGKIARVKTDQPFSIWSPLALIRVDETVCDSVFAEFVLQSSLVQAQIETMANSNTQLNIGMKDIPKLRFALPPRDEQSAIARFLDHETAKINALIAEQEKLIALLAEKLQATISHAVTRGLNKHAPTKDSGVPWLGDVPAHWTISRLGNLFREVNMPGNDELPVLSVSIHDGVSDKALGDAEMDRKVTRSDDKSKYKAVRPGDLTYNMMRAWQGGFGTVTVEGMVSPAYVVARPVSTFLTSFVEAVLRTPAAVTEIKRHSRGITDFRLRLYWEEFKNIQVALPSKDEQVDIASFVEKVVCKAERLAAEAGRGIELLKERRSALIAAAVTGQIDVRGLVPQETVAA